MTATLPLAELLSTDRVALDQNLTSKKSVLEKASRLLAAQGESAGSRDIFEALCQRERLGSTGLGHGVAIPHCRVGQEGVTGAFIRLTRPIDFDSPDAAPVDLFFALAVPSQCSDTHLKMLARIAELFSDPEQRDALRWSRNYRELIDALSGAATSERR